MARRRHGRDVHGILLLDKPTGWTSNAALQRVKRIFGARKAGHTGSLDPLASGLLPICFGQATKMSELLLDADKRYDVVGRFGAKTDTGDADGAQIAETEKLPTEDELRRVLPRFTGNISQIPPMYSALKHRGERLYKLARQGIAVDRPARDIQIYELNLVDYDGRDARFAVRCSKGTYVRTLLEDIAEATGSCAHVTALRRTGAGPFGPDQMLELDALAHLAEQGRDVLDRVLLPVDSAVSHWPSVELGRDSAFYLMNGQPVTVPLAPTEGWVRLYGDDHRFLGMGEVIPDGRVAPRRLFRL